MIGAVVKSRGLGRSGNACGIVVTRPSNETSIARRHISVRIISVRIRAATRLRDRMLSNRIIGPGRTACDIAARGDVAHGIVSHL